MYYGGRKGDVFLGGPSGTPVLLSTVDDPHAGLSDGGFGLDVYEPQFSAWSLDMWSQNKYNVRLTITDSATERIFYFWCAIL